MNREALSPPASPGAPEREQTPLPPHACCAACTAEVRPAPRVREARQAEPATLRRAGELMASLLVFLAALGIRSRFPGMGPALAADAALLAVYAWHGCRVARAALGTLRHRRMLDENALMTVATLGALALGELPEAAAVMLLFTMGEFLQGWAVQRSRQAIRALLDIRPEAAWVRRGGQLLRVPPEEVAVGEEIVVRPGERIPLDGVAIEGSSFLDTSALTGEPVPRRVKPGDLVWAGTVNTSGTLTVRVTRPYQESSAARLLGLVEAASSRKAPTERFITAFARYYTPAVMAAAGALATLPPLLLPGAEWGEWVHRGLVLLVVACPCALVISVPLGYLGGLGGASRRGILVKGAHFLDALTRLDTVVWDKTGTLTRGSFRVVAVEAQPGFSRQEVLELAAYAEAYSPHPIAQAIARAYGRPLDRSRVAEAEEFPGFGVRARVDGRPVLVGSRRLLQREEIPCPNAADGEAAVAVYVAVGRTPAGKLVIADEVKPEAAEAVRALRALGVRRQVMLTGDRSAAAERVARQLGLDEVHAELLPEDKLALLERLETQQRAAGPGGALAFVGDGINDAPALARAQVGIAMGVLGTDAAVEAADVVIMDDDPRRLAEAVRVARFTRRIVLQNIALALGVKGIFVALGAAGAASMWEAVLADVGVALLAILNAIRTLQVPRDRPGAPAPGCAPAPAGGDGRASASGRVQLP